MNADWGVFGRSVKQAKNKGPAVASRLAVLTAAAAVICGCGSSNPASGSDGGLDGGKTTGPSIAIVSPAEDAVAGQITIKAEATGTAKIEYLTCTLGGAQLNDSDSGNNVFLATVDTTSFKDGPTEILCMGGDGSGTGRASRTITIGNENPVSFLVYMSEPVADVASVKVMNESGNLITIIKPDTGGKLGGKLPPGVYTFEVSGGYYISKALTSAVGSATPVVVQLYGRLSGRAAIYAGKPAEVVITPLTHLREQLYKALAAKGLQDAEARSLSLLSGHYGNGFDLYQSPVSGDVRSSAGQHWLALAAFEQLAVDICRARGLTPETVNAEDVLGVLSDDLSDALLDGKGGALGIFGFNVDSYFFRFWYAASMKHLGPSFADIQTLIYTVSTDDSELFPASDLPREVVDQPPRVVDIWFRTAASGGLTAYDRQSGAVPYSNTASFELRFRVVPAKDQKVPAGNVRVASNEVDCSAPVLLDEANFQYGSTCKFNLSSKDGEKEISVGATDETGNNALLNLAAVKDVTPPIVKVGGCPDKPEKSTSADLKFLVDLTETNIMALTYKINGLNETPCSADSENQLTGAAGLGDGENLLAVTAKDRAGNIGMDSCKIVIDDTPPSAGPSAVARYYPSGNSKATGSTKLIVVVDRDNITDNITASREIESLYTLYEDDAHVYTGPVPLMSGNDRYFNIDWDLTPNRKYSYELALRDEAGNRAVIDSITWYVDHIPPPIVISGPEGAYSQYYDAVVSMGTGTADPEGVLYPPFEELAKVGWKDGTGGKTGFCTKREPGIFDCHVDLGKNPAPGVHYLYFYGYDAQDNHQTDDAKCGDYNMHCLKYPVTFYTTAPNITGFAVSPDKTADGVLIAWDIENLETVYSCRIGYVDGKYFMAVYDCSQDRGKTISLVSKGLNDHRFLVRLVADRNGITAVADRSLLLDRQKPVVGDPELTAQDDSSFAVRYVVSDLSPASIDARLAHRWYFDEAEGVKIEEDKTYTLGKNSVTVSNPEFTYQKDQLPGGIYKMISIEACDEVQNCQSGAEHPFVGDAVVIREARGISHQVCSEDACFSTERVVNGFKIRPKSFKTVPCDTCIDDILPKSGKMFIKGSSGETTLSAFALFWNAIKPVDPMYGGVFKFPYEFDADHTYHENNGIISGPSHFIKTDIVPFIQSCRSVPPADYICEYMLNDVTQALFEQTGCINSIGVDGKIVTGDWMSCKNVSSMAQQLKDHPNTVAVKYCTSDGQCIIVLGKMADPVWARFSMSGRYYEHEVF